MTHINCGGMIVDSTCQKCGRTGRVEEQVVFTPTEQIEYEILDDEYKAREAMEDATQDM